MIYNCSSCAGYGYLQGQEPCEDCNAKGYKEVSEKTLEMLRKARLAMRKHGVPLSEMYRRMGIEI